MVRLDFSGIWFGSQLDEKHLFDWAAEIPGFLHWEKDTLVMRSCLSGASLKDIVALFSRYEVPMVQLAQFLTEKNKSWFAARTCIGTSACSESNLTHHCSGPPPAAVELKR